MEVIDVKAAKEYVMGNYPNDPLLKHIAVSLLEQLPKVEAKVVIHGNWVAVPSSDMMTGKAYKCSECGKMRYGSYMPNYCAHCGAKMDGVNNDEPATSD